MTRFIPQFEPVILPEYIEAVTKQMESGWIGTSGMTEEFENAIQNYTGGHVISTTSGTMAIFLGLSALNIPKTKKIAFPTYTFLAGANVIKSLGYEIEFVDIDCDTMCMSPDKLREVIGPDLGAVVFVNHNGYSLADRDAIHWMCQQHGIHFIEDSAQALGVDPSAGLMGVFGVFSFSVPKIITTGQGGVIFTRDDELAARARQIRDHGDNWRKDKIHSHVGMNLKFNDMAAALGKAQLDRLPQILTTRDRIFDNYNKYLKLQDCGYYSTWMVVYRTNKADTIIAALKAENIQAVKYYRPIPSNPPFLLDPTKYTGAEYVYQHHLYLPSSLNLTANEIEQICNIIRKVEDEEEGVHYGDIRSGR